MKRLSLCIIAAALCIMCTSCKSEIEKREEQLPESEILETVMPMIEEHYDGILEENYDKCFGNYAPFYRAAVEDELKYYNYKSKEEYISGSRETLTSKFGDDVEISIEIIDSERLALKRISDYKKLIKDIFALGTPHITDGIQIVTNVTYSGFICEESEQTAWTAFLINDEWYLYDSYYEDVSAAFESEQKNKDDNSAPHTVIVQ